MKLLLLRFAILLALALGTPAATAAPCAGFVDVDDGSPFCPNVEWLKNRKVTLGCTATQYCPSDPVTRLQMAAFMNRLGSALTGEVLRVELAPGAIDLDLAPVVCQSAPYAVSDYPRRAVLDATLSASAPTPIAVGASVVVSTDGGTNWQPAAAADSRAHIPAALWGQVSDIASLDLAVGQSVRFGMRVVRVGAGSADLSDSRCALRGVITSRDGSVSPF